MLKAHVSALALASSILAFTVHAQFADTVISYSPGSGFFQGFTNPAVALGEPSRVTRSTFGWIGTPATDGSLFGNNPGTTQVSVSRDGKVFYSLNPVLAPTVDNLVP